MFKHLHALPIFLAKPFYVQLAFAIVFLVAFGLSPMEVLAQPESILSETSYFEGNIRYKIRVSGPMAQELKMYNDLEFMELYIKDNNYLIHLYGTPPDPPPPFDPNNPKFDMPKQVFPTSHLFLADSNQTYILDAKNARYFLTNAHLKSRDLNPPEAFPTGDSMLVANVLCYAYKVIKKDEEITYYINPRIRVNLSRFKGLDNASANFLTRGLNGCIPLRTVRKNKDYEVKIDATHVLPQKINRSDFQLPLSFERQEYDYRR